MIWVLNGHIIFRSARCPVRINSRRIRIPLQRLALSQVALMMFFWGVLALLSMAAAAKSPSRQREAAARHRRRQGIPVRLPRRGDRAASMRALRFARSAEAAAVGPPPPLPALPAPPQFVPEQLRRFRRFVRACWDYRRSWLCSSLSTAASIAISLVPARPSAPRAVLLSLAVARLGLQEGVEAILQHLFRRDWRSVEQALRGGRMQTGTRRSAVFTHGLDGAAQHRAYLQRWASSSVFAWLVSAVHRQQPSCLVCPISRDAGLTPRRISSRLWLRRASRSGTPSPLARAADAPSLLWWKVSASQCPGCPAFGRGSRPLPICRSKLLSSLWPRRRAGGSGVR